MIGVWSAPKIISRRGLLRRLAGRAALAAAFKTAHAAAEAAPKVHRVDIRQFEYQPSALQVRPGDKITFANHDIAPHTATADDYSWDTGKLARGQSAEVVVMDDMFASYFCVFHPHMTAKLVMLPA